MNLLRNISELFGFSEYLPRATGAILSPRDPRDIPVTAIKPSLGYTPKTYKTNIAHLPILDQKQQPACTGYAHAQIVRDFEYKETGVFDPISPRFYYALAKQRDGYPGDGTQPRVVADISRILGGVSEEVVPSDTSLSKQAYTSILLDPELEDEAYPYRTKGYAYVDHTDIERIKQAIFLYGLVEITISMGNIKKDGRVFPHKENLNQHRVVAYGYKHSNRLKIYFINSWGAKFGDNGLGYFYLDDYLSVPLATSEWMVYTDIPNEVREEYKKKWTMKYFTPKEVEGLDMKLVEALDKARDIAGIPFKITSGKRTQAQNQASGGSPNSSHLRGLAADLACVESDKRHYILLGLLTCGTQMFIEICKKHIHVDIDHNIHDLDQVMWSDDE